MKTRRGYSGNASFSFEIERYKHNITGELITPDAQYELEGQHCSDSKYTYTNIELQVKGNAYYDCGKTYGEPSDCYPAEGEININSVIGPDKNDWLDFLTDDEVNRIKDLIDEAAQEDEPEPDIDDCDPDYYWNGIV